jgi:hypothetical protein
MRIFYAVLIEVLLLLLGVVGALASEAPGAASSPGAIVAEADKPDDLSRIEIESALDVTSRRSVFGYSAVVYSPLGVLNESGVRVKLEGVNGGYHYNTVGDPNFVEPPVSSFHGHFMEGSAAFGYEHVTDTLSIAAFTGIDYQSATQNSFTGANAVLVGAPFSSTVNPTLGDRVGVKFTIGVDYLPNDNWSFVLEGNYSTANNTWLARTQLGYAVMKEIFLGPELRFQGNNFYQQWRAGVHMRGLKVGPIEIGVSTGFLSDSVVGNGVFGTFETSVRF